MQVRAGPSLDHRYGAAESGPLEHNENNYAKLLKHLE